MFYTREQAADSECTQTMADNNSNNTFLPVITCCASELTLESNFVIIKLQEWAI